MSIDEATIRRRLKEIRKNLGFTENEVAKKLGKTYNSYVSKIENGQQKLNIDIINELTKIYNIEPITLFQESVHALSKPKDFFSRAEFRADSRLLSENSKNRIKALLPSLRKLGKAMKAIGQPYLQLTDFYSRKHINPQSAIEAKKIGQEAARAFRAKYNIGSDPIANIQSFIWQYTKIPVCGIELDRECWGFYSKDNFDNPLILYSTDHPFQERNVFTIVHELGHHFFNPNEGHADFNDDNQTLNESIADGFAQELLVPTQSLNEFFENKGFDVLNELKSRHIIELCQYFNVSFRMMAYILYLQRKINLEGYHKFKVLRKSDLERLNYPNKENPLQTIELTVYLRDVVATGLRKGTINSLLASEMLNMTTKEVEALI